MILGAWLHQADDLPHDQQVKLAAQNGIRSARCYHLDHGKVLSPYLIENGMGLLAGIHVNADQLLKDWRSQVHIDQLSAYHELGVPLDAICIGNELREGGDAPDLKRFTARLSFGLANVIDACRHWLISQGLHTRLTYAMEGIVLDEYGYFHEWLWPLIDACDIVGLNAYPMGPEAWFGFSAFEESRAFLQEPRKRHDRLSRFEYQLRAVLGQLEKIGKPLILTETGFPSAIGYDKVGKKRIMPITDGENYGYAMWEFLELIKGINFEYSSCIHGLYFYEWRDNLYHPKIWNIEQSPIHIAFGLCDHLGKPKFDLSTIFSGEYNK